MIKALERAAAPYLNGKMLDIGCGINVRSGNATVVTEHIGVDT